MATRTSARHSPATKAAKNSYKKNSQSKTRKSQSSEFFSSREDRDYTEILKDLASNPAVRYVATGVATALITRLANKMADRYPEISSFIKENLDTIEGKFGEFRQDRESETSARH